MIIGAATALALADAGADVVVSARTRDELDLLAAQVRERGRQAHVVVGDLTDLDHVARSPTRRTSGSAAWTTSSTTSARRHRRRSSAPRPRTSSRPSGTTS